MRKIILLVFILTVFTFCFLGINAAQAQIQYLKSYGFPNQDEWLIGIEPADETGQFWAAGLTKSVGQDDFLILKMDSAGQIIWADTLGSPMHNERIFGFDRDKATGTMWISGSRTDFDGTQQVAILMKLDTNGKYELEISGSSSSLSNFGFHSPVALPDGGVMAYATNKNSGLTISPNLRRLDASGTQKMVEQYFDGNTGLPEQSIAVLPDLRYFTIRPFGQNFSNNLRAELSFHDKNGQFIWKKDIESPSGSGKTRAQNIVFDPSDSSVIVAHFESTTRRFLTKIDVTGNLKWQVETNDWYSGSTNYPRLVLDGNGGVGLLFEKIFELRSVENGAFMSANDFSGPNQDWEYVLADATFLPSGKVAAVGKSDLHEINGCFVLLSGGDFEILEEKPIGTSGLNGDDSSPLIEEADGHIFVMSGANYGYSKSRELVLRKINPTNGEEIWVKNYGTALDDLPTDILRLSDGNLLLVARKNSGTADLDSIYVTKVNPSGGDIFWEKQFSSPSNYSGINGAATPDGGAILVYIATVPDPTNPIGGIGFQLQGLRINDTGEKVWWRWFEPTWSSVLTTGQRGIEKILPLSDGNFLAVGMEDKRSGLVLKINADNGDVSVFSLLEPVALNDDRRLVSAVQFQNGEMAVLSRNYLNEDSLIFYRLAPDGDILMRKTMKVAKFHYGSSLHMGNDGGLLMLLSFDSYGWNGPAGLQILRLDNDFNTLSEMVLFDKEKRPGDACLLADGSFALAGVHTPTNTQDIYLIKTLLIPTVSTNNFSKEMVIQVFPNPISDGESLQIYLKNDYLGKVKMEILSLDGRLLSVIEKEKTAQSMVFEIENLTFNCSFFIRCSDGKGTATRLVLKL